MSDVINFTIQRPRLSGVGWTPTTRARGWGVRVSREGWTVCVAVFMFPLFLARFPPLRFDEIPPEI